MVNKVCWEFLRTKAGLDQPVFNLNGTDIRIYELWMLVNNWGILAA
ncbi:hypothetical protein SAMN04487995_1786 [Dyadobacter koreensis]|uniref:Uncharacterized protein n=1 Tax=Dyadobacter koreensis TaxID=408657 RepID=A0A1H6T252_9BACT|nr:hypothetical protein SAMN04487995_1786 [Dyadobacter koreensis]